MTAGLLRRVVDFAHALRGAGVPVSAAEEIDVARVLGAVDLTDREQLREGLAAALVKRAAHRRAFDVLFDLWFPAAIGDPTGTDPDPDRDADGDPDGLDPDARREALRGRLRALLVDGSDEALRRFAREVVAQLGRTDAQPGRQSWFTYRILRQLSPETLVASLLDALLAGERGGLAEKLARTTIDERLETFREHVDSEVRRRVAEERGIEQVGKHAVPPLVDQVDFLRATRDDLAALRRTVHPLARRLATRLAARRRHGRTGRLDVRRTVRASLATGGVPVVTHHRPRRPHKPQLVVLTDVSGSAAGFAHFTLLLTTALREQFSNVRAFAFIDTCDEVTRLLGPGIELSDGVSRMAREADLVWFDGHSDYGHAFEVFAERWPDAVGPDTSLLILGDARNNYRSPGLPTLRRLVGAARHAYWLNPEPARHWGSGDSVAPAYGQVLPMVECRNAAQLTRFVEHLLPD
ncbi:MAG TPA: VWA domain-containing protein [Mycobacteriales bacterium]|nr:VWA domain-containing protein [Mycobacteriales bacterium]